MRALIAATTSFGAFISVIGLTVWAVDQAANQSTRNNDKHVGQLEQNSLEKKALHVDNSVWNKIHSEEIKKWLNDLKIPLPDPKFDQKFFREQQKTALNEGRNLTSIAVEEGKTIEIPTYEFIIRAIGNLKWYEQNKAIILQKYPGKYTDTLVTDLITKCKSLNGLEEKIAELQFVADNTIGNISPGYVGVYRE